MRIISKNLGRIDMLFFWILVGLVGGGFLIFLSASIGLLARDAAPFESIALTRLAAVGIGAGAAYAVSRYNYKNLARYSLYLLVGAFLLSLLVFVPGIGVEHGGAQRWISVFGLSIQPSEFLKIAFVIYAAAFFASVKDRIQTVVYGLLPLLVFLGIAAILLLLQPDTDTFVVLCIALCAIFLSSGGKLRHLVIVGVLLAAGLVVLVASRPYLLDRVQTFFNPGSDPQGSGYQIQQSLIAIGSGGVMGRGFGQSVQKFFHLPEPIGDSIFAVAAEEFGFVGSVILILLFLAFFLRGLRIAARAPDRFSGLLAVGIVILIGASAFINMGAMLGVLPLSGLPLAFVSHGGTALVFTLVEAGILLNISRYQRA